MSYLLIVTAMLLSLPCFAQGIIFFNNRTSIGDAPISRPDGTGAGAGFTAQLYLLNGSTFTPLTPTTTFRTTSPAVAYFINALDIVVPGVPAGSPATFRMRVFETACSWDAANAAGSTFWRGESGDVQVPQLGVFNPPDGVPTPDLAGLQGFDLIPEPSIIGLGLLAAVPLLYRRGHR